MYYLAQTSCITLIVCIIYYPYGMFLPGRHIENESYRYGFNGMEKDNELKGTGNSYTTPFRQFDSRIGRWLSLDPLMASYPGQSAYNTFNNNPIYFADPTGLEGDPKVGDMQTNADKKQEVYNGTEWVLAGETERFQATLGETYVRQGASGSWSYSMVNSVFVDLDATSKLENTYGAGHDSYILGTTLVIPVTDIEDVDAIYTSYLGDNKVNNIAVKIHGGMSPNLLNPEVLEGGLLLTATGVDADGFTTGPLTSSLTIKYYGDGTMDPSNDEQKDAKAFGQLLGRLSDGGVFVSGACNIGQDAKFMERTRPFLPENLGGFYINRDLGHYEYGSIGGAKPMLVTLTSDKIEFVKGWAEWGIINQKQVDKGKPAKYGQSNMGLKRIPEVTIDAKGYNLNFLAAPRTF